MLTGFLCFVSLCLTKQNSFLTYSFQLNYQTVTLINIYNYFQLSLDSILDHPSNTIPLQVGYCSFMRMFHHFFLFNVFLAGSELKCDVRINENISKIVRGFERLIHLISYNLYDSMS